MNISKSDYLRYKQCPKSLLLYKTRFDERDHSAALDNILEKGQRIGLAAHGLFPNGSRIEYRQGSYLEMAEETKELINSGENTIYEGVFIHDNYFVICDIIHRDHKGWHIYEVKSSTQTKERYLDDIAFQSYVLKNSGLDIQTINLIYINNKYERFGELDLNQLFTIEDMTKEIEDHLSAVPNTVFVNRKMYHILVQN